MGLGASAALAIAKMPMAAPSMRFSGNNGSYHGESQFALGLQNSDSFEVIRLSLKGQRPAASKYVSNSVYNAHIAEFDNGASYLVPKDALDWFSRNRSVVGSPGGQFVSTRREIDNLLLKTQGDIGGIEAELGIPSGNWQGRELMRIDIPKPRQLNVRIPSGNELGANELWIPGGRLPDNTIEAVLDPIPLGRFSETSILESLRRLLSK